jgi:hypothetical protein
MYITNFFCYFIYKIMINSILEGFIIMILMGISFIGMIHDPITKTKTPLNIMEKILTIGLLLPLKLTFIGILFIALYQLNILLS